MTCAEITQLVHDWTSFQEYYSMGTQIFYLKNAYLGVSDIMFC